VVDIALVVSFWGRGGVFVSGLLCVIDVVLLASRNKIVLRPAKEKGIGDDMIYSG
jgi:hypothetical protein